MENLVKIRVKVLKNKLVKMEVRRFTIVQMCLQVTLISTNNSRSPNSNFLKDPIGLSLPIKSKKRKPKKNPISVKFLLKMFLKINK